MADARCQHPDFVAEVDVNRLEDIGAFTADIRIRCSECDEAFVFIGPASGLSPSQVRVSIDGSELHAPIQPRSWGRTGLIGYAGFDVKASDV